MAKLYFSYAAMNAGKSTLLLQASYNYRERGMETLLEGDQVDIGGNDKYISLCRRHWEETVGSWPQPVKG